MLVCIHFCVEAPLFSQFSFWWYWADAWATGQQIFWCPHSSVSYLTWIWCLFVVGHTEEGLYPPRIPDHFLSLCSTGNGPGWHRPHTSPLNPSTVACVETWRLSLELSHRSPHFWQEKSSLAFRKLPVCVFVWAQLRGSAQNEDAGRGSVSFSPLLQPLSNVSLSILWESLLYMFTWELTCWSCTGRDDRPLWIWPRPDKHSWFVPFIQDGTFSTLASSFSFNFHVWHECFPWWSTYIAYMWPFGETEQFWQIIIKTVKNDND